MKKQDAWHHAWSQVDTTTNPDFFIRFLDATRDKLVRAAHSNPAQFFAYLNVQEGHSILDAGCGTGDILHPLAQLVGATGRVVGFDYSLEMLVEARKRAAHNQARVEYCLADAHQLPFPDAMFDRCMATAVLQHLEAPDRALAELIRVVKPGGQIVLTEPDWETQVIDATNRDVTRRILHFFCDSIRHGGIGHTLPALLYEKGLRRVQVTSLTTIGTGETKAIVDWLMESARRANEAGLLSTEETEDWLTEQEARVRQGRFFSAFTTFRVSAQKE